MNPNKFFRSRKSAGAKIHRHNMPVSIHQLTRRNLDQLLVRLRPHRIVDQAVQSRVRVIIDDVARRGDAALLQYTAQFDGVVLHPEELRVQGREFDQARRQVTGEQLAALKVSLANIRKVEQHRLARLSGRMQTSPGVSVRATVRPLSSVGCYVPGGRAVYPSSVLMNVVPAQVAGVKRIVLCSPPSATKTIHPLILVAAKLCGVHEVYRVGGAQAIAALAFGTQTIKPVQKIIGPGSAYVAAAKLAVSDRVAIDAPAGPSELLVIADETADPVNVAADMLSQAEHGHDSIVGLVTTSSKLAKQVVAALRERLDAVERSATIAQALAQNGFVLTCNSMKLAVEFTNGFAPEHLEIIARQAHSLANEIEAAGLILLGNYSPVAASDYVVGSNHVLPTGGAAKTYSGLSVIDFVRRVNIVHCSRKGLKGLMPSLRALALAEGLPNHYRAAAERFRHRRQ
ncbi:MAG: histidinol dehydrogenase [Blastocatellia bacterium]|nr:histidinol dehydrogenase [Blastocatellia bacterium]